MNLDWNLLRPVDIGARFSEGVQQGRALRIQGAQDSALATLARDPSNPSALAGLTAVNPELGMRVQKAALEREQLASRRQIGQQAARGNLTGARTAALAVGDMDYAKQLGEMSEDQRKEMAAKAKILAPLYPHLETMPYEERKAFLQQVAPRLAAHGIPADTITGYDPTDENVRADRLLTEKLTKPDKEEGYTLNPGAIRYDSAGNIVAQSPYAPTVTADGVVYERQPTGGSITGGGGQPRGIRNNNPGNIEDGPFARSQPGYKGSDGRFAIFDSPGAGGRAAAALVGSYIGRGVDTPVEIVNRWAPPGENSPESRANYAAHIARTLGIGVNDKVSPAMAAKVVQAQREFENGTWQAGGVRPLTPAKAEERPKPTETRAVGGRTYYKVNGRWYDNAEGV